MNKITNMNSISLYVEDRIKKNKNFMAVICGQTGSGKSYWALKWAEITQPLLNGSQFTAQQVCFKGSDLMRAINSGNYPPGSIFIWDEAGVGMSSRDFQSVVNKMLLYMMQTIRHRNYIFILTVPSFSFIDAGARKLIHSHGIMEGIDYRQNTSTCKLRMISTNEMTGKTYAKMLRVTRNGVKRKIASLTLGIPSKELLKEYEKYKSAFTTELNKRIQSELERVEENNLPKTKKDLTPRQEEVLEQIKAKKDLDAIAAELQVTKDALYRTMGQIKKKGYSFKPVKEGSKVKYYAIDDFDIKS